MRKILAATAVVLSTLALGTAPAQQPAATTYIRAGHLFDSSSGHYLDNVTLAIANQRVKSIEPAGFDGVGQFGEIAGAARQRPEFTDWQT